MQRIAALVIAGLIVFASHAVAETVRVGISRLSSCSPVAIALAQGYFAAEGLDVQPTYFDSQQPIAVAVTSGDLDFGVSAETAALFSLAGGGKLKVIGGGASEAPTFHYLAVVASNPAYASGLRTPRDIAGHSFALTQMGTGLNFILAEVAEKYGFDLKSVKILPLQSNGNVASALAGGRADVAIFNSNGALPLIAKGDAKLLGWIGDMVGLDQAYLLFASSKMTDEHGDTVKRLLAAYRKGTEDYYAAFTDDHDRRADGPTAAETVAIIAKYLGQPVDEVKQGLPYFDKEARVDVADVQRQIDWYRSQGFMKADVNAAAIVDMRYVIARPDQRAAAP